MREDLDKKLCETFPILYSGRKLPMTQTAMCWGFEHDDGWFDIIWDLSEKLESINNTKLKDNNIKIVASQVKEKFGTLRFYVNGTTPDVSDEVYKLIDEAETASEKTCERCGKEGKLCGKGWVSTKCKECQTEEKLPDVVLEDA